MRCLTGRVRALSGPAVAVIDGDSGCGDEVAAADDVVAVGGDVTAPAGPGARM